MEQKLLFLANLLFCVTMLTAGCGNKSGEDLLQNIPVFSDLSPEEAVEVIQQRAADTDFIILDVRTYQEFAAEHITDAINLDYYAPDFEESINDLDHNKIYLVYCGSGTRSRAAVSLMQQDGFVAVYNLAGGLAALKDVTDSQQVLVSCGCP